MTFPLNLNYFQFNNQSFSLSLYLTYHLLIKKTFWVERERFLSREKWENEVWIAPQLYIENVAQWIEIAIENLSSTKSRHKWICRGAIEDLLTAKITLIDQETVKNLSVRQNAQKFVSMDREVVEILSRRNLEISMDRRSIEILSRLKKENSIEIKSVKDPSRKGVFQGKRNT